MSLEFLITSFIVILVPGTGAIYTILAGLIAGARASILAAFGCTLSILSHIIASVFGLAVILHTSAMLFQVLKFAGAAYLIYLAYQIWQQQGPLRVDKTQKMPPSAFGIIRTGVLINVLNPKLSIFFMAFLPQFVDVANGGATMQMLLLGGTFMAMTFAVFVVYGLCAAALGAQVLASETIMRWMRRSVAFAFAGFGARLALAER